MHENIQTSQYAGDKAHPCFNQHPDHRAPPPKTETVGDAEEDRLKGVKPHERVVFAGFNLEKEDAGDKPQQVS